MDTRIWRQIDFIAVGAMLGLITLGLMLIYSASYSGVAADGPVLDHPTTRQAVYAAIGMVILIAVSFLDYRSLGRMAPMLYFAMMLALVSVLVFGESMYGAKRWIDLGFFQFQPSELAKLVLIIVLAKYLSDRQDQIKTFKTFVFSILLILPPIGLIFLQPDVGTLMIIATVWIGLALMSGVAMRYFLSLFGLGLMSLPLLYDIALHSYMRDRIESFLDPQKDPLGVSYNVIQAEISVGSGGLFGKGLLHGTQTQLNYLRVQSTDFIFSVLGEELGFFGGILLLSLFVILLFRALGTAEKARDQFGRLLVCGIVIVITMQAFLNIAVNTRLLPATGVPLPFVSAGGTALLTFMLSIGLVQSVASRRSR